MHLSNVLQLETVLATCSCCSCVYLCCQVVALLEIPYIFSFYRCTIFYIYIAMYIIYINIYTYICIQYAFLIIRHIVCFIYVYVSIYIANLHYNFIT